MLNDMKRLILTFAFMLSCALISAAQETKMEILPDKKVLYVNSLGLPGSTAVKDVLNSMPELISRDGAMEFSNFDIQIDGKSTGGGRDVILEQTKISELEKVEITVSPTVDQQQSGQGGVINLVPAKLKDGFSGEAFAGVSTSVDVMPGVNLNYKKGKLELRGSFNMEYYHPEEMKYSETYSADKTVYSTDTVSTRYGQETAKIFLKYDFTEKDSFKMWAWESFEKQRADRNGFRSTQWDMSESKGKGWIWEEDELFQSRDILQRLNVSALAEYKHTYGLGSNFTLSASYKYNNTNKENVTGNRFSKTLKPYVVGGDAKLNHVFINDENRKIELNSGLNSSFTPTRSDANEGHELYLSPFVTMKCRVRNVTIHAGVRYQFNHRHFSAGGLDAFKKDEHDVTANLNVLWNINRHHALRLTGTRNIIRPGSEKMYPELIMNYDSGKWIKGNPELNNTMLHAVDAVYVFTKHADVHDWMVSAGVGYDIANNLVKEDVRPVASPGTSAPEFYTTYVNSGENHILRGNVSMTYQVGMFSLLFSGNIFGNFNTDSAVGDNHAYYNLSVTPIFNFKRNWILSAKALYNSAVETGKITYGDALVISMNLSKVIGNWTIHARLSDIFDYLTYDESNSNGERFISAYDLYPRYVGLGFSYRF
mgnify:CR=1 FL=1